MLILEVLDVGLDGVQTRKSSGISAARQHTRKCCPVSCLVCLYVLIASEDTNVTSRKFPTISYNCFIFCTLLEKIKTIGAIATEKNYLSIYQ